MFVFPLFLNSLQLLKETELGANIRRLFVKFFILDEKYSAGVKQILSHRRAACCAEIVRVSHPHFSPVCAVLSHG